MITHDLERSGADLRRFSGHLGPTPIWRLSTLPSLRRVTALEGLDCLIPLKLVLSQRVKDLSVPLAGSGSKIYNVTVAVGIFLFHNRLSTRQLQAG